MTDVSAPVYTYQVLREAEDEVVILGDDDAEYGGVVSREDGHWLGRHVGVPYAHHVVERARGKQVQVAAEIEAHHTLKRKQRLCTAKLVTQPITE